MNTLAWSGRSSVVVKVVQVYTSGGGAASEVWNDIRQQVLGVPVVRSFAAEAAYGAALLASQSNSAT